MMSKVDIELALVKVRGHIDTLGAVIMHGRQLSGNVMSFNDAITAEKNLEGLLVKASKLEKAAAIKMAKAKIKKEEVTKISSNTKEK